MISCSLTGQPAYIPVSTDSVLFKEMLSAIDRKHALEVGVVKGNLSNEKKQLLEERHSAIRDIFLDGQPITDSLVTRYFDKLLTIVKNANPQQNLTPVQLLISATFIPNAASWGEGTITYNAGLFTRLQNEAEVVFILCHELSHYLLNHSGKHMDSHLSLLYSKETQDQLKRLKQQSFNKSDELDALAKSIKFSATRHSRASESQADSMALMLFKNTGYDLEEAFLSIQLLDSIDGYKYNNPLQLKQRFSSEEFVFNDAWTKKQSGLGAMASFMEKKDSVVMDSLKTHPDIPFRKKAIESMLKAENVNRTGKKFLVNEPLFSTLQQTFDFAIIEYCYTNKRVSKALLYALQMLAQYPDNAYLHAMVGKCLQACYYKQKEHRLNKIVDIPSPRHDEAYSELLRFLNSVRLPDLARIINAWSQKNRHRFENNEDFLFVLIQNASINDLPEHSTLIKKYYTDFPNGIYKNQLQ